MTRIKKSKKPSGFFGNIHKERNENEMRYRDGVSLSDIKPGQRATVLAVDTVGSMRRRFFDIGLIENTVVECVGRSPAGDPCAYLIRGAVVAIRKEDTEDITVIPEAAKCACKTARFAGRAEKGM